MRLVRLRPDRQHQRRVPRVRYSDADETGVVHPGTRVGRFESAPAAPASRGIMTGGMRRGFLRFVFNALAILSLLVCVGVCVLWVRTRTTEYRVSRRVSADRYALVLGFNRLTLFGPPPSAMAP